jgi:hypothetical protein
MFAPVLIVCAVRLINQVHRIMGDEPGFLYLRGCPSGLGRDKSSNENG